MQHRTRLRPAAGEEGQREIAGEPAGGAGMVVDAAWPKPDPALLVSDSVVLPIQINGKRRAEIRVACGSEPAEVEALVLADDTVKARLEGLSVKKIVVVKDRIVNLVAG